MKTNGTWYKILVGLSAGMMFGGIITIGALLFWSIWCQSFPEPETLGPWLALGLGGLVTGIVGLCVLYLEGEGP